MRGDSCTMGECRDTYSATRGAPRATSRRCHPVCVCACLYSYQHLHVSIHAFMHQHTHASIPTLSLAVSLKHTRTRTRARARTHTHTHTHNHTRACMHAYIQPPKAPSCITPCMVGVSKTSVGSSEGASGAGSSAHAPRMYLFAGGKSRRSTMALRPGPSTHSHASAARHLYLCVHGFTCVRARVHARAGV